MTNHRRIGCKFFLELIFALTAYALIYLALGTVSVNASRKEVIITANEIPALILVNTFFVLAIFLGTVVLLQVLFHFGFTRLSFRRHSLISFLSMVFWGTLLLVGVSFFTNLLSAQIIGREELNPVISALADYFTESPSRMLLAPLAMLFMAGIPEETLRSYVLSIPLSARSAFLSLPTLLLTSIFFATGHLYQGVGAVIQTFFIGLCIGLIYLVRKSLWEVIWIHSLYNTLAIILMPTI